MCICTARLLRPVICVHWRRSKLVGDLSLNLVFHLRETLEEVFPLFGLRVRFWLPFRFIVDAGRCRALSGVCIYVGLSSANCFLWCFWRFLLRHRSEHSKHHRARPLLLFLLPLLLFFLDRSNLRCVFSFHELWVLLFLLDENDSAGLCRIHRLHLTRRVGVLEGLCDPHHLILRRLHAKHHPDKATPNITCDKIYPRYLITVSLWPACSQLTNLEEGVFISGYKIDWITYIKFGFALSQCYLTLDQAAFQVLHFGF